ncbi:MAG TPA: hypothetical protein VII52_05100, partial [Gemmatimonadaceae bacterium]
MELPVCIDDLMLDWQARLRTASPWVEMPLDDLGGGMWRVAQELLNAGREPDRAAQRGRLLEAAQR